MNKVTSLFKKITIIYRLYFLDGLWISSAQITAAFGGILLTTILTHYLTESDFGIYRYLISTISLITAFSLTGAMSAITQATARGNNNFYNEIILSNFRSNIFVLIISLIFSAYYFNSSNFILGAAFLSISLLQPCINTLSNTSAYLQGQGLYKKASIYRISRTSTTTVVLAIVALLTQNILILILSYLIINLLISILGYLIYKPRNKQATPELFYKKYKNYAYRNSVRNGISLISNKIDDIVVFTQVGSAEMAIFAVAKLLPEQFKSTIRTVTGLLLPKYSKEDKATSVRNLNKTSLIFLILLILTTILLLFLIPVVYKALFPKYLNTVWYAQLISLSIPSLILHLPYSILQAQIEEKSLNQLTLISSSLQIVSVIVCTIIFGLIGAIGARIAYRYLFAGFAYWYVYK